MNAVTPLPINNIEMQILESLNTAVLLTDKTLQIKYMNPAAETLFSVSNRMSHQLHLADVELYGGEKKLSEWALQAIDSLQAYTFREITMRLPDSREITVDCSLTIISDPHNEANILVEIIPVDRIMRIAREEQLISQHQAAREIARGLAHEINNPLGGLRGAAQLLERELPNKDLSEYTQIIIKEADRLQNLMKSMLGPNALPKKKTLNIYESLNHVLTLIKAEAPSSLTIKLDYDPSIPSLFVDRDQIIQATFNIMRNAWQAAGDEGTITIRTRTVRSFTIGHTFYRLVMRIDIIDDGPGIPSEIFEQIFYPMVTGRSEGTGLGLSIAQSLISLNDGLIECESVPGKTQFTILLPITRAEINDVSS